MIAPDVREILCADAVNGGGHVAPVNMQAVTRITLAKETHMKTLMLPPSCPWPLGGLLGSWTSRQADMSSCSTRRRVFLFNKEAFLRGGQENMFSC